MADSTINIFGSGGEAMVGADTINTILASMDSKLTSDDINIETLGDGTVGVDVKNDTYTINLNHTHEGMAKLVTEDVEDLPDVADMDADTIYAGVEDGEVAVLYIGGIPFYGGGGDTSSPVLRQPADGSTIDVGKIASGDSSVAKIITIKGKNLTQALTVAVTGTGYSVDKQSISAADANVGTTLTITCTNTADDAAGTLSLASSEVSCGCDLVANVSVLESLAAVKFTKQQYVETDIHPGPNTRLEIDMKFDGEFATTDKVTTDTSLIGGGSDTNYNPAKTFLVNSSDIEANGKRTISMFTETSQNPAHLLVPVSSFKTRSTMIIDMVNTQASFNGVTATIIAKTTTMPAGMKFGSNSSGVKPFGVTDVILYSLKHYENNVLAHDYRPYTKNGVVGLYDIKNDVFISSRTGVALEAVNN